MAQTPSKSASFLALISLLAVTATGCGKDSGATGGGAPAASSSAESGSSSAPAAETAVTALQRTLSDLGNRLATVRTRATTSAIKAASVSTTCDRGATAARDLSTALQEITDFANRVSSLNQRRTAEIEGDVLASEGRATSVVEQIRERISQRDREVTAARATLADAERNLIVTAASDLAAARARRDAAVAVLAEAQRNLDAERGNLTQAENALTSIAGRREESARNLLVNAATIDAELQATEDHVSAAEAAADSCSS